MTGSPDQRTVQRGGAVGVSRGGIACFYGLRYGQLLHPGSPRSAITTAGGQLKVEHLTDVPVFPQLPSRLEDVMGPGIRDNPQDDAAFYLNVWAPEDAAGLPVLVFLHGGAWASGGGAARWYRGERLAGEGLVVVTLNYRLGPTGHLDDDEPGSYHRPIEDILQALRWVQAHIADFGGDPGQVTLAGQSAGAWYAWALSTLPVAAGLFRRAALLSVPAIKPWTPVQRSAFTRAVLSAEARDPAYRQEPREALLRAGARVLSQAPGEPGAIPPMYLPVWPEDPARPASKFHVDALYLRVTRHEMSVFLPATLSGSSEMEATLAHLRARAGMAPVPPVPCPPDWPRDRITLVTRASWIAFGRFASAIAGAAEREGRLVVQRAFAALAGPARLGAAHCLDLPFQFGNRKDWRDAPMLEGWPDEEFEEVSGAVRRDLAAFVAGNQQDGHRTLGAESGPHRT
ncbi:carboxylesterase family protein [Stappia indica]|uniref:carboxylesterase family protein n=1 Tax=Stappia indica TaxID=538381 RepID=UPI001CD51EE1|nr:carboxylesterase family protein [Stappia indica]MCA1297403.1 carboxylesterase family protein [Stappia indica]